MLIINKLKREMNSKNTHSIYSPNPPSVNSSKTPKFNPKELSKYTKKLEKLVKKLFSPN